MVAGDVEPVLQFAIEQCQELDDPRLVGLSPLGHLVLHLAHGRMQVAKHRGYRLVEVELHAAVPHLDQRLLLAAAAEQRRLRAQPLEIPADRHRFGDHRAVVEHQRRHALQRVDRRIGRRLVLERAEIDRLDRHAHPLLGEKNANPPRIGRPPAVIELHRVDPPSPSFLGAIDHSAGRRSSDRRSFVRLPVQSWLPQSVSPPVLVFHPCQDK